MKISESFFIHVLQKQNLLIKERTDGQWPKPPYELVQDVALRN